MIGPPTSSPIFRRDAAKLNRELFYLGTEDYPEVAMRQIEEDKQLIEEPG